LPGGCNIGSRPIDEHINGLIALGADIIIEEGIVKAKTRGNKNRLHGTHIKLNCPSVGATETLIMAASLASKSTSLFNSSVEWAFTQFQLISNSLFSRSNSVQSALLLTSFLFAVFHPFFFQLCIHSVIPDFTYLESVKI